LGFSLLNLGVQQTGKGLSYPVVVPHFVQKMHAVSAPRWYFSEALNFGQGHRLGYFLKDGASPRFAAVKRG
jgi:hypothetical protein